jgi:hypothetical protein
MPMRFLGLLLWSILFAMGSPFVPVVYGQVLPIGSIPIGPPITRIQQNSATANVASITTPSVNDLILVFAFNGSAATIPITPAGYTNVTNGQAANGCAKKAGWKFSNGTETDTGTWVNATAVAVIVYRNVGAIGANQQGTGSTGTITYTAIVALQGTSSWVAGFAGNITSAAAAAPTGMTLVTNVPTVVASDTEAPVASWAAQTVGGNTAIGWQSAVVELRNH